MIGLLARVAKAALGWITGGALSRVLDTVDRNIDAKTNAEKVKGDIIREYHRQRPGFMRAGGFWLMVMFAAPFVAWIWAVVLASIFWCRGCAYPQTWTIAALPPPLDEWAGIIIISIFGVVGVTNLLKR